MVQYHNSVLSAVGILADKIRIILHVQNKDGENFWDQMPNITPHVCCHTYCSNQARVAKNQKTLQYLIGDSEIGGKMNVYTHLGLEDEAAEMARM